MSQKMLAQIYGVEIPNITYHLRKLYKDSELDKESTIKEILIVADNGKNYSVKHYDIDACQAQLYAESEFEKYRINQDRLFMSDYDRYLIELEDQIKKEKGEGK